MTRRFCTRRGWARPLWLGLALALALSRQPEATTQQTSPSMDLPASGAWQEDARSSGESHDWSVDLAGNDLVEIAVEPIGPAETDEWPRVTLVGPGGAAVVERDGPSVVPAIDHAGRTVISAVVPSAGRYRLRVLARGPAAASTRYRLRLVTRRLAVDSDRARLDAHRLWDEGGRLSMQSSNDARRDAVAKYDAALPLLESAGDDEALALTLGSIAAISYSRSDAARGAAAAAQATTLWTRLDRTQEEGVALSDQGLLAYLAYDHAAARRFYDDALVRHRSSGDRLGEARTLTRIGWVHYAAAELQQVLDVNTDALAVYRAAGEARGESIAYNDLGRAYIDLGDVTQAIDVFERALALRPTARYPQGAANVLIRIGLAYLAVAEWQRALDALHQARALARSAGDARTEATTLVNLGSAYATFGDTAEALRFLEPALAMSTSIGFRGAEGYALLWLGITSSLDGELTKSRDFLQRAIATQTAIKDVRGQTTSLRQLAAVQLRLGSPQEALDSITASIERAPRASGLIYTGTLTLANVKAALGNATEADALYEEALTRYRDIGARHAEGLTLAAFGRFKAAQGHHSEAHGLIDQALTIHESLRGLIVDPDLRMSYTSTSIGPYQLAIDVLMELDRQAPGAGYAASAFHTNERARARGLLEMLSASGIDLGQGVDPALVQRERSLRWSLNAKAALQTSQLAGKRDPRRLAALEKEMLELTRDFRETTTLIRQQSPASAALTDPQPLTVPEVSRLLDPGTVLLEFAAGETHSWLFAITDGSFEAFALPPQQDVEAAARHVHRLLTARQPLGGETPAARQTRVERAEVELANRSRALSELVLGPIGAKLENEWRGRRLAIVATGALQYVPFAALPLPRRTPGRAETRLVSAHEIVTLPSASSLPLLRRDAPGRRVASRTIAVLADPVFAADDPRVRKGPPEIATSPATPSPMTRAIEPWVADGARGALARLPFSRAEAVAVASQVPRASVLQATDFDATLALATSGRLNDYRIVHFATHGFINATRPELSGLALSLVDPSGRSRDGFLRLNTIYNLRLSADLVVLSACQTALGKDVAGEGLVGLTRGFMYAGARRVVASLWQVSDEATAELMKRFYAGLLQRKMAPAAALRRAQLEMARDPRWAAPYFWAGFVLQGDWTE